MTYEEMHTVAQYLYKLLDNIDTASDVAKSDDAAYRQIVEKQQERKRAVVDTNGGNTITFKPIRAVLHF